MSAGPTPASGRGIAVRRFPLTATLRAGTCTVLVLSLLLGGGSAQGFWSDTVVQVASLPLLALALWQLAHISPPRGGKVLLGLLVATFALPLLQLVPLPPDVWAKLPGREAIANAYDAAGIARPWLPLSLAPAATWRSAVSLLPAAAILVAMLSLDYEVRRQLVLIVLLVALAAVGLGLLQAIGGIRGRLYLYSTTNLGKGVGFFANRNHNAAFLYAAFTLAAGWGLGLRGKRGRSAKTHGRAAAGWSSAAYLVALVMGGAMLGLVAAGSRTGLGLGLVAGIACIALAMLQGRERRFGRALVLGGGIAVALLLAGQFVYVVLTQPAGPADLVENVRWPLAMLTAEAGWRFAPVGTGLGSFAAVYQMFEPRRLLDVWYINHAHDDWLELWLTGGVPGVLLALAFVAWFANGTIRLWRARPPDDRLKEFRLARAATIVILLVGLHSVVDYPLRTTAMMVVFAMAAALMAFRPAGAVVASADNENLDARLLPPEAVAPSRAPG